MDHMIAQSSDLDHRGSIDSKVLLRMLAYAKPYMRSVMAAVILMVATSISTLAGPYLVKLAIDTAIADSDPQRLNLLVLAYFGILFVNWFTSFGQQYLMSVVGHQAIYLLRKELFFHLQRMPFRFFDKQPTGKIMSRVTNDTEALTELISGGIAHVVGDSLLLIGIIMIMLRENWRLALLSFTMIPLLLFTATYFRNHVLQAYRQVRDTIAHVNTNLQESIAGIRVTQSFAREDANVREFNKVNKANYDANMRAISLFAVFLPFIEIIGAAGTAIVLWYGGGQVVQNVLQIGTLYLFIDYTARFYAPLRDLSQVYNSLQSAVAAAEKIFAILDTPAESDRPDAYELPRIAGNLTFQEVCFAYEPGQEVLKGISFSLPAGQTLAVVGPTGAGKTTLVNLLCRFYHATGGCILLDGHDVSAVTINSLRQQLGLVLQDTFLFNGTVRENILFGNPDATTEDVIAAAKTVYAHDFISALPDGYDTVVQERGSTLSAGQRQMIAFARALLRNPAVLILDEATASVDTRTETQIQKALEALLLGRTSVIIAHRLSTIEFADKIIVVEEGAITQEGSHQELSNIPGLYRDLLQKTCM